MEVVKISFTVRCEVTALTTDLLSHTGGAHHVKMFMCVQKLQLMTVKVKGLKRF